MAGESSALPAPLLVARTAISGIHCRFQATPSPPPPPLTDALLQLDALRPLSLVVEDLANLAIELCAHHEHMETVWRELAAQCDERVSEDDSMTHGELLGVEGWVYGWGLGWARRPANRGTFWWPNHVPVVCWHSPCLAAYLACPPWPPTSSDSQCCWWCSVRCCRTRHAASG